MEPDFSTEENIAAIASAVAPGQGAIAIIKISGPSAIEVVKNIVKVAGNQVWDSHKILYGHVMDIDGEEHIDEILAFLMKAPRSFTGEDVVEIHCHGLFLVFFDISAHICPPSA